VDETLDVTPKVEETPDVTAKVDEQSDASNCLGKKTIVPKAYNAISARVDTTPAVATMAEPANVLFIGDLVRLLLVEETGWCFDC